MKLKSLSITIMLPVTVILQKLKENQDFDTGNYGLGFVLQHRRDVTLGHATQPSQSFVDCSTLIGFDPDNLFLHIVNSLAP
jgi:hypothetical protein